MVTRELVVKTRNRSELVDITDEVSRVVREARIGEGICCLYVPHTTAGVTINESADPSVRTDVTTTLSGLVPQGAGYRHTEGNADAHVKAAIVGSSEALLVTGGRLLLGTWQGIFFCEFDGPRTRRIHVRVM